ncbi:hypothetical protein [Bacillus paralicheniformis]|uniref:hypothetical protein n=1 Tax=Bacillus paralicheniformis TaxID=1648923 RepID=UPI00186B93E5|nr:hypothetical protein [Bacillus paralicheniformis]
MTERLLVSFAILIFIAEFVVAKWMNYNTNETGLFVGLILLSIAVIRLADKNSNEKK